MKTSDETRGNVSSLKQLLPSRARIYFSPINSFIIELSIELHNAEYGLNLINNLRQKSLPNLSPDFKSLIASTLSWLNPFCLIAIRPRCVNAFMATDPFPFVNLIASFKSSIASDVCPSNWNTWARLLNKDALIGTNSMAWFNSSNEVDKFPDSATTTASFSIDLTLSNNDGSMYFNGKSLSPG